MLEITLLSAQNLMIATEYLETEQVIFITEGLQIVFHEELDRDIEEGLLELVEYVV